MVTLAFAFPGGRYHATPWGNHVNEGLVEWPPAPWRILRALLATGFASLHWKEVPAVARQLVEALASAEPSYGLPRAVAAHSRHYMAQAVLDKGREKTALVFDAWARVDGEVFVTWPVALPEASLAHLSDLCSRMGYLGRSESWVEARVLQGGEALPPGAPAFAAAGAPPPAGPGWEQVSVLAPERPDVYAKWRAASVERALAPLAVPEGKRPTAALSRKRAKATDPFPDDLLACLLVDTPWLKWHGWSQPPGSRRILYWRRADSLRVATPPPAVRPQGAPVQMVLLALATPTRNRSALPQDIRMLPLAELLHRSFASQLRQAGPEGRELIGRDAAGAPLRGHGHAHVIPLDLDGDGHLDHVLIWAPSGLGPAAQAAIRRVRATYAKKAPELAVAIAALGPLDTLRGLPEPLRARMERVIGPPGGARIWETITPFVAPRYLKAKGRNTLEGQVEEELRCRGLPDASVAVLPRDETSHRLAHFVIERQRGGKAPPRQPFLRLRVEFPRRQAGPLALGCGSHFGLGLFAAVG